MKLRGKDKGKPLEAKASGTFNFLSDLYIFVWWSLDSLIHPSGGKKK